jgi:hypothetical protein
MKKKIKGNNRLIHGTKYEYTKPKESRMEKKKPLTMNETEKYNIRNYRKDAPGAISGINTPDVELPAFNPSVPNRAWTAMRQGLDIEELTEEEKRDMYYGHDNFL